MGGLILLGIILYIGYLNDRNEALKNIEKQVLEQWKERKKSELSTIAIVVFIILLILYS